jgi:hypothetical protein
VSIPDDVDDARYIVDIITVEKAEILGKKSFLDATLCVLKIHFKLPGIEHPCAMRWK